MKALLFKTLFFLKKPKVIIIDSENSKFSTDLIYFLVKKIYHASLLNGIPEIMDLWSVIERDYAVIDSSRMELLDLEFVLKHSSQAIVAVDWSGACKQQPEFLRKKIEEIHNVLQKCQNCQNKLKIVYNSDFEGSSILSNVACQRVLTFGEKAGAQMKILPLQGTDELFFQMEENNKKYNVFTGEGTTKAINSLAMCMSVAEILGLNLFEIGQEFKYFSGFDK